jgi:YidC/Oxa1 family membrane protein insertase
MMLLQTLYTEIIYRPLLNALVGIYVFLPYADLGLAILILTIAVRVLLHPAIARAVHSQRAMIELQPRLRQIQERFKGEREAQAKATMALYREAGVHPLSGCLPVLVQLPVLIGLYRVFWTGIALTDPLLLYSFLPPLHAFNPVAFGLFNLAEKSAVLALAAGASQFLHSYLLQPASPPSGRSSDTEKIMRWQMSYVLPIVITAISWSLPSALAFYWTAFNLLAIVQQRWIERRSSHERTRRTHQPNTGEDGHPRAG